ncbi:MAG: LysR family transcriptional regulator [Rhodobacter sp.]|nr:LysR family transcriptional regulator [Paracoccaceae bacterium]MCC0077336.1 LysR family transcriptional regulator [Rhodobacter sp.]
MPDLTASPFHRHPISLRHFRTAVALSEVNSVQAAADLLAISNAAVSKTLREMEETTGCALFERGRLWLRPTQSGEAFIQAARRVLAELGALDETLRHIDAGLSGRLVIGIAVNSLQRFLGRAAVAFRAKHPDIKIEIRHGTAPALAQQILSGDIHALFCSPMPELQKDGFPYQQLHENDSRIVTGAGNTRYDEARSLRELIGAPWCLPLQGTQPREYVTRALAAKGLPAPADTIETSDLFTTLAILDSGPYLAILPARVADDLAQSGLIRSLQVAMDGSFPSVGIVWNENASQPAVRQFRTFIERDLA